MHTVTSKDGTTIAFDSYGQGSPVILVGGASQTRAGDPQTKRLAELLAQNFTVVHYDRRGRGGSTDTLPFAVEREVEDIEGLIDALGESVYLFGMSSGGALAMEAAIRLGDKVKKLAIYEVPYNDDAAAQQVWREYRTNLQRAVSENRMGDAFALFLKQVGVPDGHIAGMRKSPYWSGLEAMAPTLAYDAAVLGDHATVPVERAAQVRVPVIVIDGGASPQFMHETALTLQKAIPGAQQRTLEGQTHNVSPEMLAPVLAAFFSA